VALDQRRYQICWVTNLGNNAMSRGKRWRLKRSCERQTDPPDCMFFFWWCLES